MKYNLKPMSKGTYGFSGKVAMEIRFLEEKSQKKSKRKEALHIHGTKKSIFRNHMWKATILDNDLIQVDLGGHTPFPLNQRFRAYGFDKA
jgi:hypothetical protein